MNPLKQYKRQSMFGGWTRVELLLQLYEEAINNLKICEEKQTTPDDAIFVNAFLQSQKAILAIHSGLKPDEYEIAFNVARLLHFTLVCIEERRFGDATKVLTELHQGFLAIADEAKQLEAEGAIPPMPTTDSYQAIG